MPPGLDEIITISHGDLNTHACSDLGSTNQRGVIDEDHRGSDAGDSTRGGITSGHTLQYNLLLGCL